MSKIKRCNQLVETSSALLHIIFFRRSTSDEQLNDASLNRCMRRLHHQAFNCMSSYNILLLIRAQGSFRSICVIMHVGLSLKSQQVQMPVSRPRFQTLPDTYRHASRVLPKNHLYIYSHYSKKTYQTFAADADAASGLIARSSIDDLVDEHAIETLAVVARRHTIESALVGICAPL